MKIEPINQEISTPAKPPKNKQETVGQYAAEAGQPPKQVETAQVGGYLMHGASVGGARL